MTERTTQCDYAERLERVFRSLADHLDDTLDLVHLADVRSFGIYYDDPSVTPVAALRADACLTIPDGAVPAGDLQVREIHGGRYATVLYVGRYAESERPYRWLYGTWLPQSGEEPENAPTIEEYLNDARLVPPTELRTQIWLPLR